MKYSRTTSDSNTPTKPERRGAGRAANLHHITNSTADTLQAENISQLDGANRIVDRNAFGVTSYAMESNTNSLEDLTRNIRELQQESGINLKFDVYGVPQNSETWLVVIERHLRRNWLGCSAEVLRLRRERLMYLAGVKESSLEQRTKLSRQLYDATENEIYEAG